MFELFESTIYDFGDFRLDVRSHRLIRRESGEIVALPNKAFEVLRVLVQHAGRSISKDELFEEVWKDSIVEESNLSQTIFLLRKALGDDTKQPSFILTVPGRGYQFIAPVSRRNEDDSILDESELSGVDLPAQVTRQPTQARSRVLWLVVPILLLATVGAYQFFRPAGSAGKIRSIAILPFDDLGAEPADRYLGIGLADTLVNKFGKMKSISVRPTRTVLKYADSANEPASIGRELQVDAVLDGRIQKAGGRIRVSMQLVRTADGAMLWTGSFDAQFTNFFLVQDSIGQKVLNALAIQLDDKELRRFESRGTENEAAYQEYLVGRYYWNRRSANDLDTAIAHFRRAVELDDRFGLAHAGLAEAYAIYPFYAVVADKEALPKARAAATRALELDGELSEAFTVLAYVQSQHDFDWKGAESSYRRSIELNPNHATTRQWYGEFLAFQARYDESLDQMSRAIALDPTSQSTNTAPALAYNASRQFEKSLETVDKVLQLDPTFQIARHYKSRALYFSGRVDEGIAEAERLVADSGGSVHFKADLGFMYGHSGRREQAERTMKELNEAARTRHVSPYYFALVHISLGEKARAFELLRQAVAERDNNVIVMNVGLNFDPIRSDPAFQEILRSANF